MGRGPAGRDARSRRDGFHHCPRRPDCRHLSLFRQAPLRSGAFDDSEGRTPMNNEQIIRRAYELAEKVDVKGWTESFTPDGTFTDMSIGVTYRGPDGPTGLGKTVEVYAKAFPDMHRELYRFFSTGDVVVVELALQGTHKGPLPTPMGILPATGKRLDAPCCDVFRIVNGKIQSFNCYPAGTVIFAQLGVLSNIEAAIAVSSTPRA